MKLTGRTILITGGTSGIGLELAKQLIAQRNTVLITGRDAERLAATKSKLPVHTYLCGEFEKEMKSQKGMDVQALVKNTISGIQSDKTEIRPGLSNILYVLSRIAPRIPFGQMAKMLPTAVGARGK